MSGGKKTLQELGRKRYQRRSSAGRSSSDYQPTTQTPQAGAGPSDVFYEAFESCGSRTVPASKIGRSQQVAFKDLSKDDKDILILPADKGRATVVLDKEDYEKKVLEMLSNDKTYEKLLKDPTNRAHADNEDVKNIQNDIRQIKDDVKTMKHDLQIIKHATSGRRQQLVTENEFLQHKRSLSTDDTKDMSDTASTASIGSTGSEDESIQRSVFRGKCLAKALQRSFVDLLRRVPFDGIQDSVVSNQIISIVENERFRDWTSNLDKMRYLVTTVMKKDFDTMRKFLDVIEEYDPKLKTSILEVFRDNYEDGRLQMNDLKVCTACLITKRVNIKHICDHFFGRGLISMELHKDATDLTSSKANDHIWQRLFHELSSKRNEKVLDIMKDVIKDGEGDDIVNQSDIIKAIERDIRRRKDSFRCRCNVSRKRPV